MVGWHGRNRRGGRASGRERVFGQPARGTGREIKSRIGILGAGKNVIDAVLPVGHGRSACGKGVCARCQDWESPGRAILIERQRAAVDDAGGQVTVIGSAEHLHAQGGQVHIGIHIDGGRGIAEVPRGAGKWHGRYPLRAVKPGGAEGSDPGGVTSRRTGAVAGAGGSPASAVHIGGWGSAVKEFPAGAGFDFQRGGAASGHAHARQGLGVRRRDASQQQRASG